MKALSFLQTVKASTKSRLSFKPSREDEVNSQSEQIRDGNRSQLERFNLCERCKPWSPIDIHSIIYGGVVNTGFRPIRADVSVEQLARAPQCSICAAVLEAYYERSQEFPSLQSWPPNDIIITITGPLYIDQGREQYRIESPRQADYSDPNFIFMRVCIKLEIKCLQCKYLEDDSKEERVKEQRNQVATTTSDTHEPPSGFTITPQFRMKYTKGKTPVLCGLEWWETPYFDIQLLRNWLKYCGDAHGTRCVARAGGVDPLPEGFRVIDTQNMSVIQPVGYIRFVALSYMWACDPNGNVQLERSNVDTLEIPGSLDKVTIPGIITDSISLCRDLGERYLWVDRLCIIQDDEVTKPAQITAMDRIYSLATFTIIAALNTRDGVGLPGVCGRSRHPRASVWSHPHNADVEGTGIDLDDLIRNVVGNSLWNKRGWTFQERLLSKRRLYITESQVIFECGENQAAELLTWSPSPACERAEGVDLIEECESEESNSMTGINEISESQKATAIPSFYEPGGYSNDSFVFKETVLIQDGCRWVENYSSRQLSYETDILNAFAGVGNSLAVTWNSKMLYGVPEKYLSVCLLWDSSSTGCRGSDIPSWSWASSLAPIDYTWHCQFHNDELFQIASLVYYHYQDPIQERWIQHEITIEELTKQNELPPLRRKNSPEKWRTEEQWKECPQNPWETFKHLALNPDACSIAAMFPGSLVFNTTVASLEIDHLHYTDNGAPKEYKVFNAGLCNKQGADVGILSQMEFCWVEARRSTEGNRKYFDFIVLSGELEKWGRRKLQYLLNKCEDTWLLDVMLVERLPCKPFVARRVAVGTVKLRMWKDCEPRWETVVLC